MSYFNDYEIKNHMSGKISVHLLRLSLLNLGEMTMGPTFRVFINPPTPPQSPAQEPKTPARETQVFQAAVSPEPTPSSEIAQKISMVVGDPDSLENLVEFGDHQFSQKNLAGALIYYERANDQYPKTPDVLSRLGVVHYNLKEFENAIAYFSEYLDLQESHQILAFRAKCSFLFGESTNHVDYLTSAIDDYEKVRKAFPEDQETAEALRSAYVELAELHFKNGEIDQAIKGYTQAIVMDRSQSDYFVKRGKLYLKKKRDDLALEDFQFASQVFPSNAEPHVLQGEIYLKRKDPLRALEGFKKARNLNPNSQKIAKLYKEALAEKAAHCVRGFR